MRKKLTGLAILLAGTLLVGACGSSGGGKPAVSTDEYLPTNHLVIYGSVSRDLVDAWREGFIAAHPGMTVTYEISQPLTVVERVQAGQPGDLLITESSIPIQRLASESLLSELPKGVLDRVGDSLKDPKKFWVGVGLDPLVLIYNPALVNKESLPKGIPDLPGSLPELGFDAGTNAFRQVLGAMLNREKEEKTQKWLEELKAKKSPKAVDALSAVDEVNAGRLPAALVPASQFLLFERSRPAPNVEVHALDNSGLGLSFSQITAAVTTKGVNQNSARLFLAYALSDAGQKAMLKSEDLLYPVSGGESPSKLPGARDLGGVKQKAADLNIGDVVVLLRKTGLL